MSTPVTNVMGYKPRVVLASDGSNLDIWTFTTRSALQVATPDLWYISTRTPVSHPSALHIIMCSVDDRLLSRISTTTSAPKAWELLFAELVCHLVYCLAKVLHICAGGGTPKHLLPQGLLVDLAHGVPGHLIQHHQLGGHPVPSHPLRAPLPAQQVGSSNTCLISSTVCIYIFVTAGNI